MRKLVLSEHVSLDGFVAGPKGEMDWINVDEELFDFTGRLTDQADTAIYGRVTYQMMESYWPTAGSKPDASAHDKEHSEWYNKVDKIVLSRSLHGQKAANTTVISDQVGEQVKQIKNGPGRDILMFGSPSAAHALMRHDLIDEYWLFVNQVLLGQGIPLFFGVQEKAGLKLNLCHAFSSGVVGMHYTRERN